ncbi:MAG: hypothetical protein ACI4L8_11190 [Candidatus Fimadaptatus sp.]
MNVYPERFAFARHSRAWLMQPIHGIGMSAYQGWNLPLFALYISARVQPPASAAPDLRNGRAAEHVRPSG